MRRPLIALLVCAVLVAACSGDDDDQHAASAPESTTSTSTTTSSTTTSTTTTTALVRMPVGAVGDSNLFLVKDALPAALPEMDVTVEGIVGLTANDAVPAVERILARSPVAVGVVLGTNDARDGATSDNDLAAIRRVARRLGDVPCVRWTTLNESSRFPKMNDEARVINDELLEQTTTRPNLELIPWGSELAGHPTWLQEDGIHLSPEGQVAFTDRLAAALRACVASI